MFTYCNNNPVMRTDPTGQYPLQAAFELLYTWLSGTGEDQNYSDNARIVEQLKESNKMQSIVDEAIANYINDGQSVTSGSTEFTSAEDGSELYLAIQHCDYRISVAETRRTAGILWWKHEEVQYTAFVVVHDIYNFDELREFDSFGSTMNNLAVIYDVVVGGNDFEWYARYTYATKWTDVG